MQSSSAVPCSETICTRLESTDRIVDAFSARSLPHQLASVPASVVARRRLPPLHPPRSHGSHSPTFSSSPCPASSCSPLPAPSLTASSDHTRDPWYAHPRLRLARADRVLQSSSNSLGRRWSVCHGCRRRHHLARDQGRPKLAQGTVFDGPLAVADSCTQGDKWLGSISAIKARAPVVGGSFGVWGE